MGLQPTDRMPHYIVQPTATLVTYIPTTKVTKLGGYIHHFYYSQITVREAANNNCCGPLTYKKLDAHDLTLKDVLSKLFQNVVSV